MEYILLSGSATLFAVWILTRSRDPALAATWMTAAGLVAMADWIAIGFLDLFTFTPHLLADTKRDEALGFTLSNGSFVGAATVILSLALPGWQGVLFGTAVVGIIEVAFVEAGLFVQTGWNILHSLATFPLYFGVVQLYYREAKLRGIRSGWIRIPARIGLCIEAAAALTLTLRLFHAQTFHLQVLPKHWPNQNVGLFVVTVVAVPLMCWTLAGGWGGPLRRLLVSAALFLAADAAFVITRILSYDPPWNPWLVTVIWCVPTWLAWLADDWMDSLAARRPG